MNTHFFLECSAGHEIPLPSAAAEETAGRSLEPMAARPLFVCPQCGLVSVFSRQDVQKRESPEEDAFRQGKLNLHYIQVRCAAYGCAFPARIYVISTRAATPIGEERDIFDTKQMKDWKPSESALCAAGHKIVLDLHRPIRGLALGKSFVDSSAASAVKKIKKR